MVNEKFTDAKLPAPGEEVRVSWGLEDLHGHVRESYSGARPRIVVEIDPGQVSDDSSTVTVPPSAVNPTEASNSAWATGVRYEREVAEALARVAGRRVSTIELDADVDDAGVDIVARTSEGPVIVVQVKASRRPLNRRQTEQELLRLSRTAATVAGVGLLVSMTPIAATAGRARSRVGIVTWRNPEDDQQLAETLERLLSTS